MNFPARSLNKSSPFFRNDCLSKKDRQENDIHFKMYKLDDADGPGDVQSIKPRILEIYEIIWVKKGSGSFMLDMQKVSFQEGKIYFLYPSQLFHFQSGNKLEGYVMQFSQEFLYLSGEQSSLPFTLAFQRSSGSHCFEVEDVIRKELDEIVESLTKEFSNSFPLKMVIIRSLLVTFILYFSRKFEIRPPARIQNNCQNLYHRFSLLVEENYMTMKTVSEYADSLAVSSNYLSEVTRRVSGYSPSHHIQQRIVLEAKRLATSSNLRMKEVAVNLGFQDFSHFSKFFKTNTGICFSDYKKEVSEEKLHII